MTQRQPPCYISRQKKGSLFNLLYSMGPTFRSKTRLVVILSIISSTVLGIILFLRYPSVESRSYGLNLGVQEYAVPSEARDFTLKDINNKRISLKNYRGKIVMLNFWATWCTPCRQEMPSMEKLYRQFKNRGFVVVSVASGDDSKNVNAFIKEYNITFPALLDSDLEVTSHYKVWVLPTTYFINPKGEIIGKIHGSRDWSTKEATQYIISIVQTSL